MNDIKIHVLHTGRVCVSPYLPFGGSCGIIKAAGLTTPRRKWIWLPVSAYYIEHPKGRLLVDTGWSRAISPLGTYDRIAQIRYATRWWAKCRLEGFDWNDTEGPFSRTFDLFGDGSVKLINIPGHSDGLCAVKLRGADGSFVLLYSDGGYASRSWQELITSGISSAPAAQMRSLKWIREQSLDPKCVESLANHAPDIAPHIITI